ncbi:MFS transporter [Corynebacterium sp. TAE3-ERU16]|uniref:MFS transporter n=1 Tax=Corynebacterium sp. TAE3-ERU16 TaxID=2849493 RepID=UPI00351D12B8
MKTSARLLSRDELEKLDNMWSSPALKTTLIAVAAAFASWSLMLPVVPLAVISSGGSDSLAGSVTGVFMAGTVLTQMFTPKALRRFGYIPVMVVSAFLLCVPSALYVFSVDAIPVLTVSAVRGVGFGALTVAQSALMAELVARRFLGKASGALGLVVGLLQMLFLPTGLYLAETIGFTAVYIISSVIGIGATALCWSLPRLSPEKRESLRGTGSITETGYSVATWKLITVPALAISTIAMGYGAISSFLPAAVKELDPADGAVVGGLVLAVVGGSQMLSRYGAGIIADRRGEAGRLVIPSLVAGVIGLALATLVLAAGLNPWLLLLSALLFGAGFGAVQNEALLMMFARLPRSKVTEASAMWNIAFDSGTGLGSVVLGVVAARAAYSGSFGTAAGLVVLGLVVVLADRIIGRHRIAEYNNTRATLRRVPMARTAVRSARAIGRVGMKPVHVAELLAKNTPRPHVRRRPEGMSREEFNAELRAEAAERRALKAERKSDQREYRIQVREIRADARAHVERARREAQEYIERARAEAREMERRRLAELRSPDRPGEGGQERAPKKSSVTPVDLSPRDAGRTAPPSGTSDTDEPNTGSRVADDPTTDSDTDTTGSTR